MGGVLQRLVDRATGAGPSGLRPRRPSLFEGATAGAADQEQHLEAVTAAPQPVARETALRRPSEDARPKISTPESSMKPGPESNDTTPRETAAPKTAEPEHARPREQEIAVNPPDPPTPPAPLLPRKERVANAPPASPQPQPVLPADTISAELSPRAEKEPPPRLLSPAPERFDSEPVTTALSPTKAFDEAAPIAAEAAPPEITIHIGMLDIRSDPPQASRPSRSARKANPVSQVPTLADYLRGGGS